MTTEQIAAEHVEWKRAQAALVCEVRQENKRLNKENSMLRHHIRVAKQALAMGRPDFAADELREALFPPKEGV